MSREYTTEEVREKFLRAIAARVDFWDRESRATTSREKLEGLTHSILALLDGCDIELPAFIVAPNPHPDDKEYCIQEELDYFPRGCEDHDIGGGLHEVIRKYYESKR